MTHEDLLKDGWQEKHSHDSNYRLYCKVIKNEDGLCEKGIWKALHIATGKVIDITYEQARGYEPIKDTEIKKLSRFLGEKLLPRN